MSLRHMDAVLLCWRSGSVTGFKGLVHDGNNFHCQKISIYFFQKFKKAIIHFDRFVVGVTSLPCDYHDIKSLFWTIASFPSFKRGRMSTFALIYSVLSALHRFANTTVRTVLSISLPRYGRALVITDAWNWFSNLYAAIPLQDNWAAVLPHVGQWAIINITLNRVKLRL